MIDTRDCPSRDELERAMKLECYISELKALDTNLARLECVFKFQKYHYESQVEMLHHKKEILENKIDELEATD